MSTITDSDRILELMADLYKQEKHQAVMLLGEAGLMLDLGDRTRRLLQEKMSVSGYWCGNEHGKVLGRNAAEELSLDRGATFAQREFAKQCSTWLSMDVRSVMPSTSIETCDGIPCTGDPQPGTPSGCYSTTISVEGFIPMTAPVEIAGERVFLVRESITMHWGKDRHLHRFVRYDGERLSSISPRFYFLSLEGEKVTDLSICPEDRTMAIGFVSSDNTYLATVRIEEMTTTMRRIPRYGREPWISAEDESWLDSMVNRPMQSRGDLDRLRGIMETSGLMPHLTTERNWHGMLGIHHATLLPSISDLILHISSSWDHPFLDGMVGSGYLNLASFSMTNDFLGNLGNVSYNHVDCTRTGLPDSSVSFISCCDVAEQGADLSAFLAESSRILIPGGRMLISFDYWEDQPETRGMILRGSSPTVVDRSMVLDFLRDADELGMMVDGSIDLSCKDRTVSWGDMEHTILSILLKKDC